ncbi:MAG: YgaP family membrane protein [Brevinematia bacterium]
MFKVNEGVIDRIIRSILGIGLILVAFFLLQGVLKIILIILGIILIVTAITGFCGLYAIFDINTCSVKKK